MSKLPSTNCKITLLSLHGLIRAKEPELGRDADTGGQVKYVLELAKELVKQEGVDEVELITRQIFDERVGPDYAQVEEVIEGNAKIVRLPFGPKRYIRKESLWPYLEVFVDQALSHFKRNGLPHIIHGHYADAGRAGAQLSRLLHIPFVFTGHSLGRVKRERLEANNVAPEKIDKTYNMTTRIEAEEFALETASMVVTSTNQEVENQYKKYDHYIPDRMEVIPPGVDLDNFSPNEIDVNEHPIIAEVNRFLVEPEKPLVMAMARPDERKNLQKLVEIYGNSEKLRNESNLLLIMGTRDDLRELPKGQRNVLLQVLKLIDVYDLYGHIAYPKTHHPSDVPNLYRYAKQTGGVFINAALTEPFGLTLLEAAATGLPVVATNDGGPRDILSNCQNGILVDPLDDHEIENALLRMITDREQWQEWSDNGLKGATEHYSWSNHARRYLRDLRDILTHSDAPAVNQRLRKRQLPNFDRLLITDLDNTLTGDNDALADFLRVLDEHDFIGFGITTGRHIDSARELIQELNLPTPDFIDTAVGTELYYGEGLIPDFSWRNQIDYQWNRQGIVDLLSEQPGFFLQEEIHQSKFKISFEIDRELAPSIEEIKKMIRRAKLRANVVLSLDMYLDIVPVRGGSDNTIRHLLYRWGFAPEKVLVAGDSGNDEGMLKGRTLGVVVGNHDQSLEKLRDWPRIYFAEAAHARGIIEGIHYYQFLDNIVIPNDRFEETDED